MFSHTSNGSGKVDLIILIVLVAAAVIGTIWRKFSLQRFVISNGDSLAASDSNADSKIISFYSAGHMLLPATNGTLQTNHFATYMTMPDGSNLGFTNASAVIYALDLPFNTESHIIGLTKQHTIDRIEFDQFVQANGMERVSLEGDFDDYFDLFTASGQQVTVREVLEPNAMAFVADYCQTHFWEINNAELYIVVSDNDSSEADSIISEAVRFVQAIKPALLPGQAGAPAVHHLVSYGEYDGAALKCPICQTSMTNNRLWHVCSVGHGILIAGRELLKLRDHSIAIQIDPTKAEAHGALTCPNCQNPMTLVSYQSGGTKIDSCTNCPYRWLDADEVSSIITKI